MKAVRLNWMWQPVNTGTWEFNSASFLEIYFSSRRWDSEEKPPLSMLCLAQKMGGSISPGSSASLVVLHRFPSPRLDCPFLGRCLQGGTRPRRQRTLHANGATKMTCFWRKKKKADASQAPLRLWQQLPHCAAGIIAPGKHQAEWRHSAERG